jgi:hypothetical protein
MNRQKMKNETMKKVNQIPPSFAWFGTLCLFSVLLHGRAEVIGWLISWCGFGEIDNKESTLGYAGAGAGTGVGVGWFLW